MAAPSIVVRPATRADRDTVLRTLVQAFVDDPQQAWLFPDPARRPRRVWLGFRLIVTTAIPRRTVWMSEDGRSVAVWVPPGRPYISGVTVLTHLPALLYLLATAGRRVGELARGVRALLRRQPTRPHWYLAAVGTAPAARRRGGARAVLAPVLARCDRDGVPAALETSHESNLAYYERLGFAVTGTITLPRGPSVWFMWRDPRWSTPDAADEAGARR